MKIYTKTGDQGSTCLSNGSRIKKKHRRIGAIGYVDEINSYIGLCISLIKFQWPLATQLSHHEEVLLENLIEVQNTLFNIGSQLSYSNILTTFKEEKIKHIELQIDSMTIELPELKEFIIPGGHPLAAHLQVARTICRHTERAIIHLDEKDTVNPFILSYINRLSDYLFVLARWINHLHEVSESTWINPKHT